VIFTGFVENVYEILNIIDINVISSLSEALCLSLIEGMFVGKPSVGTDTGGIPGIIKDGRNGYLVPVGDSSKLADTILSWYGIPYLERLWEKRAGRWQLKALLPVQWQEALKSCMKLW
jgi:glycosyltransferase involved in cell wall biosynthesis